MLASAPATSRLFVLPVVARRWVSVDNNDLEVGYITCTPWKLYFDGSVCIDGQRIGAVLISPNGAVFEFSNRLEEECTNNQVEYEALLFGLEFLLARNSLARSTRSLMARLELDSFYNEPARFIISQSWLAGHNKPS